MDAVSRHVPLSVLAAFLLTAAVADALKFVVVPMNANSPALDLMAVGAKLIERGHEVAVVASDQSVEYMKRAASRHSSNTTGEAFKYITLDMGLPAVEGATTDLRAMRDSMRSKYAAPTTFWQSLMIGPRMLYLMRGYVAKPCARILGDTETLEALKQFNADAVIAVSLPITAAGVSDSCGCMMAHALNISMIDLFWSPQTSVDWNVPQYSSGFSPSSLRRPVPFLTNRLMWAVHRLAVPLWEMVYADELAAARRKLGLPQAEGTLLFKRLYDRYIRGVTNTMKCYSVKEVQMYNWLIEWPTTLQQNQVLVGPGSPRLPRPISSPSVAAFVNGASSGLVLLAVGSTVQSAALLTAADVAALAAVVNDLAPVRVLLAMSDQHLPGGMKMSQLGLREHVMTASWVDYNDVLGHPNTRLIISHGGGHSVHEAAFHGVPMVAIPFMWDSAAEYALKYIHRGAGVMSHEAPVFRRDHPDGVSYTAQNLMKLIRQVLDDPSYSAAAKAISVGLQTYARRRHPYERAADEIELAMYTHYAQQGREVLLPDSRSHTAVPAVDSGSCGLSAAAGSSGTAVAVDSSSCFAGEQVDDEDQSKQQQQQQQPNAHEEL